MGENRRTGLSERASVQAPLYGNLEKHHSQDMQQTRALSGHPRAKGQQRPRGTSPGLVRSPYKIHRAPEPVQARCPPSHAQSKPSFLGQSPGQ